MTDNILVSIEKLQELTQRFEKIFSDWKPQANHENIDYMIGRIQLQSGRSSEENILLEELLEIKFLFENKSMDN